MRCLSVQALDESPQYVGDLHLFAAVQKKVRANLWDETDFVARNEEFPGLAREIAMQVAATNPTYLNDAEISEEARTAAMAVFTAEVADKPADMQEKILAGKMQSYFRDMVLMEQPYIKDESKTIRDLLAEASQKFGERVEVSKFARFSAR